jgi:hypothetical protein
MRSCCYSPPNSFLQALDEPKICNGTDKTRELFSAYILNQLQSNLPSDISFVGTKAENLFGDGAVGQNNDYNIINSFIVNVSVLC